MSLWEANMLRLRLRGVTVLVALLVSALGCTGGGGHPETAEVTGKVTHNGGAVAGAMVSFSPDGAGTAAAGVTDATGKFSLTTFASGDGAVPGKYKVSISKVQQPISADVATATADNPDAAYAAAEAAGADVMATGRGSRATGGSAASLQPQDLLPAKYKDANTSGLTAEVAKGGNNHFEFDLK
jgi:hypothetical protein